MAARVHFGCFEADIASGQLYKRGVKIGVREKSFQVLASLLEHRGEVVSREELHRRLWPEEVFVDFDNNLNAAVARLREALGDSPEHPRFIETLPKRGYRFLASVSESELPKDPVAGARAKLIVLPFLNLTGDPAQEYLSDGITDEIITQLAAARPKRLAVIARTTAMHFKGSQKDVSQIGRKLRVDYVLEGGVSRIGARVGVSVQLIQVRDQMHAFARKYEGELRDIFNMQSSIADAVTAHIPETTEKCRAGAVGGPTTRRPTEDNGAYNAYLKGRYLFEKGTPAAAAKAMQYFENAIRRDPEFAPAHMAMADLYSLSGYLGFMRPKDAYATGIAHALRAVEIDDALAEAHAVLAEYHKQVDYNWLAAEREMARALELNPTSPFVKFRNAIVVAMPQNRMGEAVAEIEGALELDPLAGLTRGWLGIMLLLARDYDRAIDEARDLLDLEPISCWPHFITGIAYRQKYADELIAGHSRPDFAAKAVAEHRKAVELSPESNFFLGWLGLALGVCGRRSEAKAVLNQFQRSERYILPSNFAHVHLGLGEIDTAFEWFDRAVDERDQMMIPILSYAHYDPIRQDPRFSALLRKMNLD